MLAPHEMMELHELFNMKTAGLAKAKAIDGMVTDKDLKMLIEQDIAQSMQDIRDLQPYLEQARTQEQARTYEHSRTEARPQG
jgi:similar to spore coat protein